MNCFFVFICVSSVLIGSFAFTKHDLNKRADKLDILTDALLAEVRLILLTNNETSVPIEPINVTFTTTILDINVNGGFIGYNGTFRNPASITREGPTSIKHSLFSYKLSFEVGFNEMSLYFPFYKVYMSFITETGDVYVGIGKNSVFIELTVTLLPHCNVTLTKVKITKFDKLDVRITGLSILNSLEGPIVEWVLESYRDTITPMIENVIQTKLQEEFSKIKWCKFQNF